VDDYQNILESWKILLESEGYRVSDSSRALQLFASHPVDEVVLDYEIPGMSGDVVACEMKAMKPTVPILMLSGDDPLPQDRVKAVEAFFFGGGADHNPSDHGQNVIEQRSFYAHYLSGLGSGQRGGRKGN
jgi:CheY-like chemotaxis protein